MSWHRKHGSRWCAPEQRLLVVLVERHGEAWELISETIGRSAHACQERYELITAAAAVPATETAAERQEREFLLVSALDHPAPVALSRKPVEPGVGGVHLW